jgi:hypothetical protein
MRNKRNLNHNGNDPIEFAEFSSEEWCTESRLPMSLSQTCLFVNKAKHRQHCLQCWTLNPEPCSLRDIPLESHPQPFVLLLFVKSSIAQDSVKMYLIRVC